MPTGLCARFGLNQANGRAQRSKPHSIARHQLTEHGQKRPELAQLGEAERAIDVAGTEIVTGLSDLVIPGIDRAIRGKGEVAIDHGARLLAYAMIAQQTEPL